MSEYRSVVPAFHIPEVKYVAFVNPLTYQVLPDKAVMSDILA